MDPVGIQAACGRQSYRIVLVSYGGKPFCYVEVKIAASLKLSMKSEPNVNRN
jgi:hypothetical protein